MGDWTPTERRFSELPARLVSALILIPLALGAVWMGGAWLAAGCAIFAFVMMQEWCGMSATPKAIVFSVVGAIFGLTLFLESFELSAGLVVAALVLGLLVSAPNRASKTAAMFGVIYVFGMVGALFALREGPWGGRSAALYFMAIVWASDAAAYFFGRAIGGPKLLPAESPNKTWSGAIAAVLICGLSGYLASLINGSDAAMWVVSGIAISMAAQAGDLFESGLKRRFKVKDSGRILPGHGGLLDRVDGLGAVSVVAAVVFWSFPAFPTVLGLQNS